MLSCCILYLLPVVVTMAVPQTEYNYIHTYVRTYIMYRYILYVRMYVHINVHVCTGSRLEYCAHAHTCIHAHLLYIAKQLSNAAK